MQLKTSYVMNSIFKKLSGQLPEQKRNLSKSPPKYLTFKKHFSAQFLFSKNLKWLLMNPICFSGKQLSQLHFYLRVYQVLQGDFF